MDEEKFFGSIKTLRKTAGDRAILRAMHFFSENKNAKAQTKALESGDFNEFLRLFKKSGDSSYKYLQNIYLPSSPLNEDLALALALGENVLGDLGVCRVHGGGFAGTIQAMVPNEKLKIYSEKLTAVFGVKSVIPIKIRQYGLIELSDKLN